MASESLFSSFHHVTLHQPISSQVQRGSSSAATAPVTIRAATTTHRPNTQNTSRLYTGMWDALRQIYRVGGVAGLFKGSGARMAFHAPSTAISMATFEKAKEAWGAALGPGHKR